MNESTIFGVSARGILALIVTIATCVLAIWVKDIGVLKDLAFLALGSYFGQRANQPASTTVTTPNVSVNTSSGAEVKSV